MLVFGGSFQIIAYAAQSLRPSWQIFVASFFIGGIGMAMQVSYSSTLSIYGKTKNKCQDAHANAFIALVKHQNEFKMGLMHAAYG